MSSLDGARSERLIAKRYEERGYTVIMEPPLSAIPFSLEGFRPDILATKGSENLIIEVKIQGAPVNSELYFKVDEEVQRHPGWQFLIVTITKEEIQELARDNTAKLDLEALRKNLGELDAVLEKDIPAGLIIPALWVMYISSIRLLVAEYGLDCDVTHEDLTDLSLINKAYSDGLISFEEHQSSKRFYNLRNNLVHGFGVLASKQEYQELRRMINEVLYRLKSS